MLGLLPYGLQLFHIFLSQASVVFPRKAPGIERGTGETLVPLSLAAFGFVVCCVDLTLTVLTVGQTQLQSGRYLVPCAQ